MASNNKRAGDAKQRAAKPLSPHFAIAAEHLKAGRYDDARLGYQRVLAAQPDHAPSLHAIGLIEHAQGNFGLAAQYIEHSLALLPGYPEAHANLSAVQTALGEYPKAVESAKKAVALRFDYAIAHFNLANALKHLRKWNDAAAAYQKAIDINPSLLAAYVALAEVRMQAGDYDAADTVCHLALKLAPNAAAVHVMRARLLQQQGDYDASIKAYECAILFDSTNAVFHTEYGRVLRLAGRYEEAIAAHKEAIRLEPKLVDAYDNLGVVLQGLGRLEESLEAYRGALTCAPNDAGSWSHVGALHLQMHNRAEAREALTKALTIDPDHNEARVHLALALQQDTLFEEAFQEFQKVLASDPNHLLAHYYACDLRYHLCQWDGLLEAENRFLEAARAADFRAGPFAYLLMQKATPLDHLEQARRWAKGLWLSRGKGAAAASKAAHEMPFHADKPTRKLRIGYLSNDFCEHATVTLITEMLELHDRSAFEIFGYCYSPRDDNASRRRLRAAFDRFCEIHELSFQDAAARIEADGIDILVDLKGYTMGARTEIMAYRPAPIQVNFLGYPATMGADFIDYIIADATVAPFEHAAHFDEKIVHLPHSYQPNDKKRAHVAQTPQRSACGLPETGFVFCSFNNAYKITDAVFCVWMRLLQAMPGSVLWLLETNDIATRSLRREAEKRGLDPARLVFAPKVSLAEHLARLPLADVFLDSLPVNAHTTASEALWAGVPVLTILGEAFVSRVAASLLRGVGLPELVTQDLAAYEATALRLANEKDELAGLRTRLADNRATAPLFDTAQYTRDLEQAYVHMARRKAQGHAPEAFAITASSSVSPSQSQSLQSSAQGSSMHQHPQSQSQPTPAPQPQAPQQKAGGKLLQILKKDGLVIKILDVGVAYFGEQPPYQPLLNLGIADLYSFDADEREVTNYKSYFGENVKVLPFAIGDGKRHTFHVCPPRSGMSSLLEPDPVALQFFNGFPEYGRVERTIEMETRRLDDIADLPLIDYLKMDIQGSEMMVLRNGWTKLAHCVMIQSEISFVPLYKNQATFGDMDIEFRAHGYMPHCMTETKKWSIFPTTVDNDPKVPFNQLLEGDMVYVKNILNAQGLSSDQLRKIALIANYVYQSPDLVMRCVLELLTRNELTRAAVSELMQTQLQAW